MKKWTVVPVHSYFALIVFLLCCLSSSIDCSGNCAKGRKRSWSCRRPWVTCRSTSSRNVNMCWGSMLKMTGWRSVHGSLRMTHWQTEGQSMVHWEWCINRLKVSPWFIENNRLKVSPWFTENDTLTDWKSVHGSLRIIDRMTHWQTEGQSMVRWEWQTDGQSVCLLRIIDWRSVHGPLKMIAWRSVHGSLRRKHWQTEGQSIVVRVGISSIIACFSPVCSLDWSFYLLLFLYGKSCDYFAVLPRVSVLVEVFI